MLNQRGQAFSVFELMIAAIVAVAILFVLLPIVNQGFDFGSNAKDSIGNSLAAVDTGGNTTSQPFTLSNGDRVTSKDFASNSIDPHSVVFGIHSSLSNMGDNFEVGLGDDYSFLIYDGSTNFKAEAKVYCQPTGEDLEDLMSDTSLDDEISDYESPIDLCGEDEYQPCCIVLIDRG